MSVIIRHGDCREILKTLPDQSVHMCCTSPPYFGLRDYGHAGQIGLEATPDAFVAEMVAVFREVKRVLRDDGTLFLNLGDSYFGGGRGGNPLDSPHQKQRTNRGTVSMPASARHGAACDTSDKELEGSPENDCLCGNLCGACRAAYRLGKSHSNNPLAPMPAVSTSLSILAHRGLPSDHLPMSGLVRQDGHSEAAILDRRPLLSRDDGQNLASLASMSVECDPPLQRTRLAASTQGEGCLSCGRSLTDCGPMIADSLACICDTGLRLGASNQGKSGKSSSGSASPHLTTTSLKPKDLIGIPWRVAFALHADGWYLRQDIIWSKPNPMPESVTDRCTKAHEYIFLLSKSARYHYDAKAVEEPLSEVSRSQIENYKRQGESGVVLGGLDKSRNDTGGRLDQKGRGARGAAMVNLTGRNKRSVWEVTTQPFSEAHFATFPPDLIEPCIKAGCPAHTCAKCGSPWVRDIEYGEPDKQTTRGKQPWTAETGQRDSSGGLPRREIRTRGFIPSCACDWAYTAPPGVILDPFGGAGTTGLVADRLGRDAILIELNPDYAAMAQRRIEGDAGMFADVQ